jgi:hypothetical protein
MRSAGEWAEFRGGGFALSIEAHAVEEITFLPRERGAPKTLRGCVGEGGPSPRAYGGLRGRRICDVGRGRRVGARGLQTPAQWLLQRGGAPLRPREHAMCVGMCHGRAWARRRPGVPGSQSAAIAAHSPAERDWRAVPCTVVFDCLCCLKSGPPDQPRINSKRAAPRPPGSLRSRMPFPFPGNGRFFTSRAILAHGMNQFRSRLEPARCPSQ